MSQPNTPIHERVKLGWQKATVDPRSLKLSAYITPDLPAPPDTLDWMTKAGKWPVLSNDRIGDCVVVTMAHLVQGWTAYTADKPLLISNTDVVKAYSGISGYNPRTGANDNGCVSNRALNFWRRTGLGGEKIVAYVKVNHKDLQAVKAAMNLFGGIFLAAELPTDAGRQFDRRQAWTPTSGSGGRVGGWGGHAVHAGAFDADGVTVSTWGRAQKASWPWITKYADEAWAVLSQRWVTAATAKSPLGFDLPAMLDDLDNIAPLNPTR